MLAYLSSSKIKKIFPTIDDALEQKLQIDIESLHYITYHFYSDIITNILEDHLLKYNLSIHNMILVDTTAGVGGNTISFSKKCNQVHAIEINSNRYCYLINNVKLYNLQNVFFYNDCCLSIFNNLYNKLKKIDIIFIDPPWGGSLYKYKSNITLTLSNIKIEHICNFFLKFNPKLIVLKLPFNYDVSYFKKNIRNNKIIFFKLRSILLAIIDNI